MSDSLDDVMDALEELFEQHSFRFGNETVLQEGIGKMLSKAQISFKAEHRLSPADRIDFMVGEVGLEVKVQGSESDVQLQLLRYAAHDEVKALILVAGTHRLDVMPVELLGKPVRVIQVRRALF